MALGLMAVTTPMPAADADADAAPAGPHQLSNVALALVGAAFNRAAVRAILPVGPPAFR